MWNIESFWDEQHWLPPGVTWADLEQFKKQGGRIPHLSDLWIVIPIALIMILIRRLFEYTIGTPVANSLGIKNARVSKPEKCQVLEDFLKHRRRLDFTDLSLLLEKLDESWNQRRVERWFRRKKAQGARPLTAKFGETMWRGFFYTVAYSYGSYVVLANSWFWNTLDCWTNYPMHDLTWDVKYYYITELAFYLSLCFTLFSDTIRKDFLAQIVHHVATIALITFSYACGFTRIGVLVMWLHDISDIFLEIAKCFVYAKKQVIADHLFNLFAVIFFISRIIYFPFVVLHTTLVKSMWLYKPFFGYYFFNFLLAVLQLLHLYWFYLILEMAYNLLKGKEISDTRSEDEFSVEESDNDNLPDAKKTK
ncbi:unnamed protein product [Oikopleura dioica]|uniref:TLC domain-containing protein n=1 Tax=Oikopleura dioica TaxID=34765 RepID=E4X132_OIKDI|nr:unnamed protein product [Oikopleura dioica]